MKNIKTFEIFGGARITKSIKNDIIKFKRKLSDFMVSIIDGNMNSFNKLIDKVDLEEEDIYGNTALLLASSNGRLNMLKKLIKKGANIHHKNNKGEDFYDVAEYQYKFINNVKKYIEENFPEFVASKKYNL